MPSNKMEQVNERLQIRFVLCSVSPKFIKVSGTMELIHFEASYYRVTGTWLRLMEPND